MDPVSIISLVNVSVGLAIKAGTIAKDIQTISSQYKNAEVSIVALSNECRTFGTVLTRIEAWLRSAEDGVTHDDMILEQLSSNLECGSIVLKAMEDDLLAFTETERKRSPWGKTKFVFNEGVFDAHQKRIGGQLQALSCLLQSMSLPTPAVQRKHIDDNETIFHMAESSAWTIVNSGASISGWQTDHATTDDGHDLEYKPLPFENDLFTSRVYKRNFRPKEKKILSKPDSGKNWGEVSIYSSGPPPSHWQPGDFLNRFSQLLTEERLNFSNICQAVTNPQYLERQIDQTTTNDGADSNYVSLSSTNDLPTSQVHERNLKPNKNELMSRTELKIALEDTPRSPLPLLTNSMYPEGNVEIELEMFLQEITDDLWYPPPNALMSDERRAYVHEHVLYLMQDKVRPRDAFLQSVCNQSDDHVLDVLESILERDDADLHETLDMIDSEAHRIFVEQCEKRKLERLQWLAGWKRKTLVSKSSYPSGPPLLLITGDAKVDYPPSTSSNPFFRAFSSDWGDLEHSPRSLSAIPEEEGIDF